MKTVKELATCIGVSKTSIYNLIKNRKIHVFKKDGTTYIDESGVSLILMHYSVDQHHNVGGDGGAHPSPQTEDIQDDIQDFQPNFQPNEFNNKEPESKRLITILENQLIEKDKIIQELIQSNQSLIQTLNNQQTLQLVDKQTLSLTDGLEKPTTKRSFWSKFFLRN